MYAPRQSGTVAKQKEQQIQHDKKADDKIKGILANAQGLCGDELATLGQCLRQPFLDDAGAVQAKAVQQAGDPARQRVVHLLEINSKIKLARFHPLVHRQCLLHQQGTNQGQRKNHQDQNNADSRQR